jgi:hypothetical protein
MFLITDELVRAVRTAVPCRRNASANRAENVSSSYRFCRMAVRAMLRVFVCVARLGRSGRPARIPGIVTCSTSSSCSSSSNSNTGSSSASESALQVVAPDTPDQQTAWVLVAHQAARQEQHDKSAFPARLAEVLRRHGMAVRAGRTSTHVMQGITNELMHLKRA